MFNEKMVHGKVRPFYNTKYDHHRHSHNTITSRKGLIPVLERTFHDAIYEEEYGSDNEDECCRCRGLSAILCWFLSVIILVGLAATVVLTVFFILRSRTMMTKPDVDLDVEMYGKDQNLYEPGGGTSKELMGSNESSAIESGKRRKIGKHRDKERDSTKNDVDADVNEEQNTIVDSEQDDQAENASVNHPRNHHPNHYTNTQRHNRLQPYTTSPTTTTTTTEAPVSEEETSEEETETEQNNGGGSSLFNLFSGPRNPSYNTPQAHDDEFVSKESTIRHGHHAHRGVISAESAETRFNDGSPVQQVLFTESPKVTVTTPNPYNNRRNLQTTRFPTGRTSFSTTTTQTPVEESNEEDKNDEHEDDDTNNHEHQDEDEDEEEDGDDEGDNQNDDNEDEESHDNENANHHNHDGTDDNEHIHTHKSSEEEGKDENATEEKKLASSSSTPPTTTTLDDANSEERESEMGSESGESQLKQMLLDEIPPHKDNGKVDKEGSGEEASLSSSQEFNLSQKVTLTTTSKPPLKTTKQVKSRGDTLTRLITRNFTRKVSNIGTTSASTAPSTSSKTETSTSTPSVTTLGPGGHKYDYTLTPWERTKLKTKSSESGEQVVVVTKPSTKSRYRSTTTKSPNVATPEPPSTAAPASFRTRGTTSAPTSNEYSIKLGGKRGSVESPIDIVPSPDLSPKGPHANQNSAEGVDLNSASSEDTGKTSEQFLDVLVGSEDHKTLVTKKIDGGIVTSAILPPWYDANGANSSISDVLATNGTTVSNTVAKIQNDGDFGSKMSAEEKRAEVQSGEKEGASEFERLVDMFSKQQASSEESAPPPRFGFKKQKPLVLKKPGGLINSRYIPQVPGRASLFPSGGDSKESTKQSSEKGPDPSTSPEDAQPSAATVDQTGDVDRTGILSTGSDAAAAVATSGYYPEDNAKDKAVEHQLIESERFSDEMIDSLEAEPSHVIDVNIEEPDSPTEIIIDHDQSGQADDGEGDFTDDDYGYGNDPPTLAMAGSEPTQQVVPVPPEFVRGSGIRRPVSSEETDGDLEPSAATIVEENNATNTASTTESTPQIPVASFPPTVIRRPAYTREEIAKASVKPSPASMTLPSANVDAPETASDEFEEYEEDGYEDGSGSAEGWSGEKTNDSKKWSEPDKVRDEAQHFGGPDVEHNELPAESIVHANINHVESSPQPYLQNSSTSGNNSTASFTPPKLLSFHENKLSFSPPVQHDGSYHSKDGWRPVLSDTVRNPGSPEGIYAEGSHEPHSGQGSYESEQHEDAEHTPEQMHHEQQLPQQQMLTPQQWSPEMNTVAHQPQDVDIGKIKPSPMIPPPIPAAVKFPDSEEDHEDRHHHGRHKIHHPTHHIPMNNFDRSKYMTRPVPPPIVMRRHPHSTGPFPPPPPAGPPLNRQAPPPPAPPRNQMIPQASQPNPQFVEHPQARPPPPHMNRNFHMRPNPPMRRFNFGPPPKAQPRSGGNIKWPEDDKSHSENEQVNQESAQSEVNTNTKRRRRRALG